MLTVRYRRAERDNVTIGLVYINLQPEYELPSSTRFGQFRKFGKMELGHSPLHP